MPGYRAHLVGGAATYVLVYFTITHYIKATPVIAFQWAVICLLGSLFPDIDIKSKGQGIFYRLLTVFLIYLSYKGLWDIFVIMSFLALLPLLSRHRGIFHKLWFITGMPFIVALVIWNSFPGHTVMLFSSALFFAAGATSHIVLDRG